MRTGASRAVVHLDAFCQPLETLGLLTGSIEGLRLGGWLKMGMVGTPPAGGRTLFVGDAAGLVDPLQGDRPGCGLGKTLRQADQRVEPGS